MTLASPLTHTAGGIGPVAGTTPYPWPWDRGCAGPALALVVAGWDSGWRHRAGGPSADTVEAAVGPLAAGVLAAGGLVVTLTHLGPPRLADPTATALVLDGARAVPTAGLDGFWGSGLDALLRAAGATHLLVAGHGLEGPVHSTLRGANDQGYEGLLVLDAASPLRPDLVGASRSMVEMSGGIFGAVGTTADVLAALRPLPAPPEGGPA